MRLGVSHVVNNDVSVRLVRDANCQYQLMVSNQQDIAQAVGQQAALIPLAVVANAQRLAGDVEFVDLRMQRELQLTNRQREVLHALLNGYCVKQIASRLMISKRTVEHHLQAIKTENQLKSIQDILLNVRAI